MAKPKTSSKSTSKSEKSERTMTLAEIWDNTDSSEASNNLPEGEQEVRLNSIELSSDKKKGDAAIITYEAIEGDYEGKTLRQLYKLRDADGNKGPGTAFLMRDLELLGYKDIDGKKLPKVLKEISEEQPMVIINAKKNGQYMNAYLQGTPEDVGGKSGDDDEDDDAVKIEVGDTVTGDNDDGDEVTGEVLKINKKKGVATVRDEDDGEHICDIDGLTKGEAEAEKDEEAPKKKGKKAEPEPEEEGEEEVALEVGDEVEGENDDGDDVKGKIIKIKKDSATVEDEDGGEHKCALSDLKKVEEEAEEEEIEVGSKVKWEDEDGDEQTGKIKALAKGIATIKGTDGETHKVKLKELELQ